MKRTTYYLALVVGILLTISTATSLKAAHIVGGEMSYICLGNDPANPENMLYEFTMFVYRDCFTSNTNFDGVGQNSATPHVSIFFGENDNFQRFDAGGPADALILNSPTVTDVMGGVNNPCVEVPSSLCVKRAVYIFQQSLPIIDETYYVVYQRCCRNNTIVNIPDPDEVGATYSVTINPVAQLECNNSPSFNNFPEILICVNEPLDFDHSATDFDGDQLVYRFCSPLTGGSQGDPAPNPDDPPPYTESLFNLPTYSALAPLNGAPTVTINPLTGLISGTPNIQGQHVVGICVDEFRNGTLLSSVQRDFQFNIVVCDNLVKAGIGGTVNSGGEYVIESCVDSTITITNTSFDEAFIISYLWEFDIPGIPQPLSFSERDLEITFPGPGNYSGIMTINLGLDCSDFAFVNVIIAPPILPDFSFDYDTCVAGPVEFMNTTSLSGLNIINTNWDFGDGNTSNETNPIHQYQTPGEKLVTLTLTDTLGCFEAYQQTVTWFPVPPVIIIEPSTAIGCPPEVVSFTNLSTPIDTTYLVEWNFGDGLFGDGLNPVTTYRIPGTYDVSVAITSPIGCYTTDTFPKLIFIDSLPEAEYVFSPGRGVSNFRPTVDFYDLSFNAAWWEWDFGGLDSTILQNPTYTFRDTGKQEVKLVITSFYGCTDTTIQIVDVKPKVTYYMPNAFTPNEDGKNEVFGPTGIFRGIRNYQMAIWDRWGQVVFQTTDFNEGWNGRFRNEGKYAPNGVYVYKSFFIGPRGEPQEFEGFATLIR